MTREEFDNLPEETPVWFHPSYFAFPMLGVVRTINGLRGVWINFFGDAQCHFAPLAYHPPLYDNVTLYDNKQDKETTTCPCASSAQGSKNKENI